MDIGLELANVATTKASYLVGRLQCSEELELSAKLHNESIEISKQHHDTLLNAQEDFYTKKSSTNLAQHFLLSISDLWNSHRDNERDMFDKRSQQYQALIIASSVMFSSLSTVIIQGYLPMNHKITVLSIFYSITCSLSFACLFISIIINIFIVSRASKETIRMSNQYLMNRRGSIRLERNNNLALNFEMDMESNFNQLDGMIHSCMDIMKKTIEGKSQKISTSNKSIDEDCLHSINIDNSSNNYSNSCSTGDCHSETKKFQLFEEFWSENLSVWSSFAMKLFMAGVFHLLVAITIYMWITFYLTYKSTIGAVLSMAIIIPGITAGFVLIYRNMNDTKAAVAATKGSTIIV